MGGSSFFPSLQRQQGPPLLALRAREAEHATALRRGHEFQLIGGVAEEAEQGAARA
jgi:hypothetical protein